MKKIKNYTMLLLLFIKDTIKFIWNNIIKILLIILLMILIFNYKNIFNVNITNNNILPKQNIEAKK